MAKLGQQPASSGPPPPPAHHHPAAKIEIFIDYARPWEPMDLDADDVVGALQEKLLWY